MWDLTSFCSRKGERDTALPESVSDCFSKQLRGGLPIFATFSLQGNQWARFLGSVLWPWIRVGGFLYFYV